MMASACIICLQCTSTVDLYQLPFPNKNHITQTASLSDPHSLSLLLKSCTTIRSLSQATQLHAHLLKLGISSDPYIQNSLIQAYSACDSLALAHQLFDQMPQRTVVSWNCMMAGYSNHGHWKELYSLFLQMMHESSVKPNSVTLVRALTACVKLGDFDTGWRIHRFIKDDFREMPLNLANALLNMYAKSGEMEFAQRFFDNMTEKDVISWTTMISGFAKSGNMAFGRMVFNHMPERTTVSWNAMLSGYIENGLFEDGVSLFLEMVGASEKPDKVTFLNVLALCVRLEHLYMGRSIHGYMHKIGIEPRVNLINSLIEMYIKCGDMQCAKCLFERMSEKNEASWTSMMVGYVKCGCMDRAMKLFNEMPERDVVSWNAIIASHAQKGYPHEALDLFNKMLCSDVSPDGVTLVSALSACGKLGALEQGMWIHALILRNNIERDVHLGTSLVDMYAKCGCIELALGAFHNMPSKDLYAWSTMIQGLAMNGNGENALELLKMMENEGQLPDDVVFLSVLTACSHAGLVQEGRHCFDLMKHYGLCPKAEHYTCMVDLLARNGLLDEAKEFIEKMSLTGEAEWRAVLGACRAHGDVALAEYAAQRMIEIDPYNSGAYILLSNLYAEERRWDDVANVRKMMRDRGVQKIPGCSWTVVNGFLQLFMAGDNSFEDVSS
ncbi:hypothetical protein AMTRI_Chr03g148510 [Amborella trichopoda]